MKNVYRKNKTSRPTIKTKTTILKIEELNQFFMLIPPPKKTGGENFGKFGVVPPPPLENLGDPLPNHKSTNIRMGKVRDALAGFAKNNEAELFA